MMIHNIGDNIRHLRKEEGLSQEELASALNISYQSVSKWERGESQPDISMLLALANFFSVSTDSLLGMEVIRDDQRRSSVFRAAQAHMRERRYGEAIQLLRDELALFPADCGLLSELAMALCLDGLQTAQTKNIHEAISLCRRVLKTSMNPKLKHTTRAALCFMHRIAGDMESATALAAELPHVWESREYVLPELTGEKRTEDEALIRRLVLGE